MMTRIKPSTISLEAFVEERNNIILFVEGRCQMEAFKDTEHDIDSCWDVWEGLYKKVYPQFFKDYFDFCIIEDVETNSKCKRWYIKLRRDIDISKKFPKFKMAGDCIFNFNDKKIKMFNLWVSTKEGKELLKTCAEKHHSFENFAFMPITGGMNNLKGSQELDRPDIHISDLQKYFSNKENKILSYARGNKEALEWYLSIFNDNIYQYFSRIYLIDDRDFIDKEFLPFSNTEIKDEDSAIQYMKLAIKFWNLRKNNIDKYLKNN